MSPLRKNAIANFAGRAFTAAVGIVFVPLYVSYLGVESYGLVGFYATMLSVFGLVNSSLGATVTRQLAVLSGRADSAQQQRDLVRTLELLFWGLSALIALAVAALAAPIAKHWVNREGLSESTVADAVRYMGMVMAFEFASSYYQGGLMGLQRQVVLNVVRVSTAALRSIGVVAVLAWVSPTIGAFFAWNLLVGILQAVASGLVLWGSLPRSPRRAAFRRSVLRSVWRYTAGIIGINLTVVLLMHLDKIILSKILTLGQFGYYTLAGVAAAGLCIFIQPLSQALFPRFSQLFGSGGEEGLAHLYHLAAQFMSVLVLPAGLLVVFFSHQAMVIWTGDPVTADNTWLILSLLTTGMAMNGIMNIPTALQWASGWTSLGFQTNLVSAAILVPTLVLMAKAWGGPGAALVWVMLNVGLVFVQVPIMHRRLLRGHQWRWYIQDVGIPLLGTLAILLGARQIVPPDLSRWRGIAYLGSVWLLAIVAAGLLAPLVRTRSVEAASWLLGRMWFRRKGTGKAV